MNGLVVFPTFFNLSLKLSIRSSWSEQQSAPSLVFADSIELLYLWLQRIHQSDFSIDHLVMLCVVFSCVVEILCLLWPVCSLVKTLLAFALLHFVLQDQIPITPDISWLPTFAFQSPMMNRTSFGGVSSRRSCRPSKNHSVSASSALLVAAQTWITVILNGSEQRSFCDFWDCTQVLHFRLFCWLWGLFHFFSGILAHSSKYNGHLN